MRMLKEEKLVLFIDIDMTLVHVSNIQELKVV